MSQGTGWAVSLAFGLAIGLGAGASMDNPILGLPIGMIFVIAMATAFGVFGDDGDEIDDDAGSSDG